MEKETKDSKMGLLESGGVRDKGIMALATVWRSSTIANM